LEFCEAEFKLPKKELQPKFEKKKKRPRPPTTDVNTNTIKLCQGKTARLWSEEARHGIPALLTLCRPCIVEYIVK